MLDIIILSKTSDQAHFDMVKRCVDSYISSGDVVIKSIIIVESDKHFDSSVWSTVSPKINVITPPYTFNYNQFLNIALEQCTAEIVCVSNNDVVAKDKCVVAMHEFFDRVPNLMSASPVDRTWHNNSYEIFPEDGKVYAGYDTTKHLLGFCVFVRRSVFDVIGPFDERFHFYHQDNDLESCLRVHKLLHVMITLCHIEHGHNKPDNGEDPSHTRSKLLTSQKVYFNKWRNPPYDKSFKPYKKLSVVTSLNNQAVNKFVEIVPCLSDVNGQYTVITDRLVDEVEQQQIIEMLNYKPTRVDINGLNITRNF